MRNALAHANKNGRRVVSAFIATAFAQTTPEAATKQWRNVADQLRAKLPKLAALLDEAEVDVLAFMTFPREHWDKISSTNPIERLNGEIKRRADVIGIFPNDDAIVRLVGAILLEQNDEWAVQRARYMTLVWGFLRQANFSILSSKQRTVDHADPRVRGEPGGGARNRAATLYSVGSFEPRP
jgi:transposase-like protein